MADSDNQAIELGRLAWQRIKRSNTLADWLAIGEALLIGRRLCMAAVGANKPRGGPYVKANKQWLTDTGFVEITKSSRQAAMLIAENLDTVKAWLADLPIRRRPVEHPVCVWRAYCAATRPRSAGEPNWRTRKSIDLATARLVQNDARLAARDIVKKCPAPTTEKIADAVFCAVLNSLDIAIPDEIFRRQSPASQRVIMPVQLVFI